MDVEIGRPAGDDDDVGGPRRGERPDFGVRRGVDDDEVAIVEGSEGAGDTVRLADLDRRARVGAQVRPGGGRRLLVEVEDRALLTGPLGGRGQMHGERGLSGASLAGDDRYGVHDRTPGFGVEATEEMGKARGFTLPSPAATPLGETTAASCPVVRRWWP